MKIHNTYPFLEVLHKVLPKVLLKFLPDPMQISMLTSDWLASYYIIPNAKFPPITALLNRSTYHKSAKGSPPPNPMGTPNQSIS